MRIFDRYRTKAITKGFRMNCPLCQGSDYQVGHTGDFMLAGQSIHQETRICRDCGMTFEVANPDLDWSSLYGDVWHRSGLPNSTQKSLYQNDARLIGPPPHAGARVFDVGCGSGLLLDELGALGWETAGCDPEQAAIQRARGRGHHVTSELFSPKPEFEADLVILGDVLEHGADPLSMLRNLRRIIRPGGRFYVRVPNLSAVNFDTFGDVFGLQHRVWFTHETLEQMLHVAGFEVEFRGEFARGMHAMTRACEPRRWQRPTDEPAFSTNIVRTYSRDMAIRRERIRRELDGLRGRDVALYGGGEHAEELLQFSSLGSIASRVVDSNHALWGQPCGSLIVERPESLRKRHPESVVIASKAYQNEIADSLSDLADQGVEIIRLYAESG